jgi:hypothetical protein
MRFIRAASPALLLFLVGTTVVPCFAQQQAGDKEIGIGGSVDMSHSSPIIGNASGQFSVGKFFTRTQFVGIEVTPTASFGASKTSVGGFLGGKYRYLFSRENTKVLPFVGVGGGAFIMQPGSGLAGSGVAEMGIKAYFSRRTSFEFGYNFLYLTGSGTQNFSQNTRSLVIISLRHLF